MGCLAVLATATVATAAMADAHDFDLAELVDVADRHRSLRRPRAVTVYLHRDGGRVYAGDDDPSGHRSGVVRRSGETRVDVPAYRGTDVSWERFTGCVANHFSDFDVTVVDERPRGDYIEVMVGGSPSLLGLEKTVGGVAPHSGDVLSSAMVFVFQTPHRSTRALCDTTAHEIGHALGLDHSRRCDDVMSYESCGSKAFRNTAAHCGEWGNRACASGSGAQNTWATLARSVGRRESPRPEPTAPRTAAPRPRLAVAPSLKVRVGPAVAHSTYVVKVDATDPDGVAHVDLVWYDRRARRLRCGTDNPNRPFSCVRRGSEYTFFIPVRTGSHKFVARYTDGRGNTKRTAAYQARFRQRSR